MTRLISNSSSKLEREIGKFLLKENEERRRKCGGKRKLEMERDGDQFDVVGGLSKSGPVNSKTREAAPRIRNPTFLHGCGWKNKDKEPWVGPGRLMQKGKENGSWASFGGLGRL
ncbi:hypothetical protein Drorol1_Dr00005512, partial [Drosera rotundifolia]